MEFFRYWLVEDVAQHLHGEGAQDEFIAADDQYAATRLSEKRWNRQQFVRCEAIEESDLPAGREWLRG